MNILIVGSGAREHALAKALNASVRKPHLYCYGTSNNPGLAQKTKAYRVGDISKVVEVTAQAVLWQIDLAIIGPEAPLEQGLADAFIACDIAVVGPKKQLAQIETSKTFARDLMKKYSIAGLPVYKTFSKMNGIADFLSALGENNYVVKANGLMGGKGVKVAGDHLHSQQEAMEFCKEIFDQGQSLIIEEKLVGQEFSFMCFFDGKTLLPMPLVQDNKRAYVGDKGPNTGGMGSFSAADHSLPFLDSTDLESAIHINKHVLEALQAETKEKYLGILYGGFMATARGVYVVEFNARFGDPEALNVLSILESDLVDLCLALTQGSLETQEVVFSKKATVCKYLVPEGYPENPLHQVEMDIQAVRDKSHLYLAAVHASQGKLYATGSRTAAYVGVADSTDLAQEIAEQEICRIQGPFFHREDIGTSALIHQRIEAMKRLRSS